ncbi:YaiI/YqxD family protein [Candidatus Contubernalis alkaliaceticus]|uniref:YaiI/YqxD family protein n=1 Tax=Candidatus Contubernalis alkaliaceticus TaxID=338645 RepID=UPI001F4C00D3|nr:DUF188 domain-containing protein [Candidatus Contubernalis alkalaceticus]UNC91395.1 DUF188 domain-containing protein [Candidatus Contubernalis alkalaceticus]
MKILVDADACPKKVLEICIRLGKKYSIPVWTVASFNHNINFENHILVGNAPEETDVKLMNISQPGDIAITQDWGLAAMLLGKYVRCLSPSGQEFLKENIDFLLEERALKAKYRRGGGRTKGPKKRADINDEKFELRLEKLLQKKSP